MPVRRRPRDRSTNPLYRIDELYLPRIHRKWFPYTAPADVPVVLLLFSQGIVMLLPGDSLHDFPSWRLLAAMLNDVSCGLIFLGLGVLIVLGTVLGRGPRLALIAFGLTSIWLVFVATTALLSAPLSLAWSAYGVLALFALIAFFRRVAAGWVRHDLRREAAQRER